MVTFSRGKCPGGGRKCSRPVVERTQSAAAGRVHAFGLARCVLARLELAVVLGMPGEDGRDGVKPTRGGGMHMQSQARAQGY